MNLFHLVARTEGGARPFTDRDACSAAWSRLARIFPETVACVLMPNHLHVITHGRPVRLARALGQWARGLASRSGVRWQPVPPAVGIPDHHHLLRQIRYVHLNPCRARLCADPLEWEWSTHRDWVGAVQAPWPDRGRWSRVLGWTEGQAPARLHRYVSADLSTRVEGTPFPQPLNRWGPDHSLDSIARAVSAVTRGPRDCHLRKGRRTLALKVALELTHYRPAELARWAGVSRSALAGWTRLPPLPPGERAALSLVLADHRLQIKEVRK
jgi:hypothetical protein